jgi:hypothetical protein
MAPSVEQAIAADEGSDEGGHADKQHQQEVEAEGQVQELL